MRAPKAIGGPKNWVGAQKKRGGGPKIRKWLCFFWFPLFLGWGPKIRSFGIISTPGFFLIYFFQVGLATAEELTRQKEQLARTEQRLDDINSTLRNSEKHIQVGKMKPMIF